MHRASKYQSAVKVWFDPQGPYFVARGQFQYDSPAGAVPTWSMLVQSMCQQSRVCSKLR